VGVTAIAKEVIVSLGRLFVCVGVSICVDVEHECGTLACAFVCERVSICVDVMHKCGTIVCYMFVMCLLCALVCMHKSVSPQYGAAG